MPQPSVNNILVPVALDEEGINAIKQAMYVHNKFDSQVTLLLVIPAKSWVHNIFFRRKYIAHKQNIYQKFEDFAKGFFKSGEIPEFVKLKVKRGTIKKLVILNLRKLKYDLIIINKKIELKPGKKAMRETWIRLVVGEALCPVLTFNGSDNFIKTISDIMIPVDIFRPHKQSVAWAIELARRFGAKVHVVSALTVNIKEEESLIYWKIKVIEKWLKKNGIECDITLLREYDKKLYDVIPEYINKQKPDLVGIMTHQEAILNSNYIGKLAEAIIEKSERPVFAITPRKETIFTILPKAFGAKQIKNQ